MKNTSWMLGSYYNKQITQQMGTCQYGKIEKRNQRREQSCDTASTDSYGPVDPFALEAITTPKKISVQRRTRSGVIHSQCERISIQKLKQNKRNPEISSDQQKSQSESSSGKNSAQGQFYTPNNFRVKQPSLLNESMIERWNDPNYSPGELFKPINFDRIFTQQ